jgi:hypothetical protein
VTNHRNEHETKIENRGAASEVLAQTMCWERSRGRNIQIGKVMQGNQAKECCEGRMNRIVQLPLPLLLLKTRDVPLLKLSIELCALKKKRVELRNRQEKRRECDSILGVVVARTFATNLVGSKNFTCRHPTIGMKKRSQSS